MLYKQWLISFSLLFVLFISACKKNNPQNGNQANNGVFVNYTIYEGTPEFFNLQIPGGWIYINAGEKGIIVYRLSNQDFRAYERKCPHDGHQCKVLNDNSTIKDTVCNSTFSIIDGTLQSGPSQYSLYQYGAYYDGTMVKIQN